MNVPFSCHAAEYLFTQCCERRIFLHPRSGSERAVVKGEGEEGS